jgi:cell division protease FtsH
MNPNKPSPKPALLAALVTFLLLSAALTLWNPLQVSLFVNEQPVDSRSTLIQEMNKNMAVWKNIEKDFSTVLSDLHNRNIAAAGVSEGALLITTLSGDKYMVADDWGQFSVKFLTDYTAVGANSFPFAILKSDTSGTGSSSMTTEEWLQLLFAPLLIIGLVIGYVVYYKFMQMFPLQKGSEIRFKDVIGAAEAKTSLADVVAYLECPQRFADMGAKPPKGVLLSGPPGVGKTILARALAGECNANFISVTGSDFSSKFYGSGIQRVKTLFKTARKKAPCIIFIDEADGIGRRTEQTSASDAESNRIINQILTEMDGFNPADGVIVVGATNYASSLDPALTREGRFDQKINVSLPGLADRKALFEFYLAKSKAVANIDCDQMARLSIGMSPASISYVISKAAFDAAKNGDKQISTMQLLESMDTFRLGGSAGSVAMMSADERRRIAYHEAGHALIGAYLSVGVVEKVTIIPRGESLGVTLIAPELDTKLHLKTTLESRIQMLLAGRLAEQLIFGEVSSGASSDLKEASKLAYSMVSSLGMGEKETLFSIDAFQDLQIPPDHANYLKEANSLLDTLNQRCMKLINDLAPALHDLAAELLKRETSPGADVTSAIAALLTEEIKVA